MWCSCVGIGIGGISLWFILQDQVIKRHVIYSYSWWCANWQEIIWKSHLLDSWNLCFAFKYGIEFYLIHQKRTKLYFHHFEWFKKTNSVNEVSYIVWLFMSCSFEIGNILGYYGNIFLLIFENVFSKV